MDAKEALRYFKEIEFVDLGVDEAGREDPHIVQAREAKQAAIEALEKVETLEAENARLREKQTPKEPRYVKEGYAYCPICGDNVNQWLGDEFINYKFCPECGQAIKKV